MTEIRNYKEDYERVCEELGYYDEAFQKGIADVFDWNCDGELEQNTADEIRGIQRVLQAYAEIVKEKRKK